MTQIFAGLRDGDQARVAQVGVARVLLFRFVALKPVVEVGLCGWSDLKNVDDYRICLIIFGCFKL